MKPSSRRFRGVGASQVVKEDIFVSPPQWLYLTEAGRSRLISAQQNSQQLREPIDRTQARNDASHVYEHLSKHRSKATTERTGSNNQTGAPRASFHYPLA